MRAMSSMSVALILCACGSSLKAEGEFEDDTGTDVSLDIAPDGDDPSPDPGEDGTPDTVAPDTGVDTALDTGVDTAVDTHETIDLVEEEPPCDPAAWFTFAATDAPRAIPDDSDVGITSSIVVTGCPIAAGDIEVVLGITHTFRGDLTVKLTTPAHDTILLHDGSGGSEDNIRTTYPTMTAPAQSICHIVPSAAAGTWTLAVIDDMPSDSGTLDSWTLRLKERQDYCPVTYYSSADHFPVPIPDDSVMGMESTIGVPVHGSISSVAVLVDITHEYMGDVFIYLESPDGADVTLYDRSGGWDEDLSALFPMDMAPVESLSAYTGRDMYGTWTLHVADLETALGGSLDGWRLYVE